MNILTKEQFIGALRKIREKGWVPNARPCNAGGIGNTLEDLLGIQENNLPIPNAAEWELKCQRQNSTSLITLFHMEPSPTAMKFVPQVLLPQYGWPHKLAGHKHPKEEMSFRQTISGLNRSNRGFGVIVDRQTRKVVISFDSSQADQDHQQWLNAVEEKVGLGELDPQPYWGFDDLFHKAGNKLHNCFFVEAEVKKEKGKDFFKYTRMSMLEQFSLEKLLVALEKGKAYVDFDARTGHNHGTKFRIRQNAVSELYKTVRDF